MLSLVVFYSQTGTTKTVAKTLAQSLAADTEQIISNLSNKSRPRLAMQALLKVHAKIGNITKDPALYDLVIVGTPIWAQNVSSPVRTYLARYKNKFNRVAFFCTYGGSGNDKVLKQMESLCGKKPVASLNVLSQDVRSGGYVQRVSQFVSELQG